MGNQLSQIFYTDSAVTTADTFKDVEKHRETIVKLTEIKIADIAVNQSKMEDTSMTAKMGAKPKNIW